jgi:hypothetical protein
MCQSPSLAWQSFWNSEILYNGPWPRCELAYYDAFWSRGKEIHGGRIFHMAREGSLSYIYIIRNLHSQCGCVSVMSARTYLVECIVIHTGLCFDKYEDLKIA